MTPLHVNMNTLRGENVRLDVIDPRELNVDHENYQRSLDMNLVERILEDWDPNAADVLTLSQRADGTLWTVNGQHTAAAAILRDEFELLAFVHEGLTVAEEADLRLKKNNRRPDTNLETFHGLLAAADKPNPTDRALRAQEINALAAKHNTRINRTSNHWTGVNCVSTLDRLYRRDDGVILGRTFRALEEAFGEIGGAAAKSALIEGVAWFLGAHEGDARYSWRRLIEQLHKTGVEELEQIANGWRRAMRGALWLNIYRAIVEVYNGNRREDFRLEPRTQRWTDQTGWHAVRDARMKPKTTSGTSAPSVSAASNGSPQGETKGDLKQAIFDVLQKAPANTCLTKQEIAAAVGRPEAGSTPWFGSMLARYVATGEIERVENDGQVLFAAAV